VSEVTQIIERARDGDSQAAAELLPIVYDELRRLAAHRMAAESGTHTLQPTALVHEAWLRLTTAKEQREFTGRAHFFCAAAEAMRRILIEHARQRLAAKRGGGVAHLDVDEIEIAGTVVNGETLLRVDEALGKLAALDARKAELVKLRYFAGMNYEETAAALGIAVSTAKEWWAYARAWLVVEMRSEPPD
jgi:RNA polymerase sigma factor (TIGR02999 family)